MRWTRLTQHRLGARPPVDGSVIRADELSVHAADNLGLRGSDLRPPHAGDVGLHFELSEQIGQRLPLCGMLDRHSIQVDAHQPVEQHHRIGAPEPEAHYRQVRSTVDMLPAHSAVALLALRRKLQHAS